MSKPPEILPLGEDGLLVRFSDTLELSANGRAIELANQLHKTELMGVKEVFPALVSTYVRFDPDTTSFSSVSDMVRRVPAFAGVAALDGSTSAEIWRLPVCFDGDYAPLLPDVAKEAGLSVLDAVSDICRRPLRVLTLGFAPGQPYLGLLGKRWDLPRQAGLTPRVETGAVVLAARQLVVFSVPSQTGWRQVGKAAFRPFQPESQEPVTLSAGMRLKLEPVSAGEFERLDPCAPLELVRS